MTIKKQLKVFGLSFVLYLYIALSSVYAVSDKTGIFFFVVFIAWFASTMSISLENNKQVGLKAKFVELFAYGWIAVGQILILFTNAKSFYFNGIALALYLMLLLYNKTNKISLQLK